MRTLRRREAVRHAAAWIAAAAGWTLAGRQAAAARPTARGTVTVVPFQMGVFVPQPDLQRATQAFVDATFNAQHRGVRAEWVVATTDTPTMVSLIASGQDVPWVQGNCCVEWLELLPFLEDLSPWVRQDGVDWKALYAPGQLGVFRQGRGLYALPSWAPCDPYIYNQTILDELGLPYPDPDWTADEAARIWRACTGALPNDGWRYGTTTPFYRETPEGMPSVVAAFGGSYMNADGTRCLLDEPACVRAGEYWYGLVWDKVATWGGGGNPAFFKGEIVFLTTALAYWPALVPGWGVGGVRWDLLPYPRFPERPIAKLHNNFYAMIRDRPNQELAWELLKFIAFGDFARFWMRATLSPPGSAYLLDEWLAVLRAVAPVLRDKHLEFAVRPVQEGYGIYDDLYFRYEPLQAQQVQMDLFGQIWDRKLDVAQGFREIARAVNAIEAVGAATAPLVAAEAAQYQKDRRAIAAGARTVAPPPKLGLGAPPVPAARLVRVRQGVFTLWGAGSGVGGAEDGLTFACQAWTQVRGDFRCRVLSLAPEGTALDPAAVVGLMARGTLSSAASMILLGVGAGSGVQLVWRTLDGEQAGETPSPPGTEQGLLSADVVTRAAGPGQDVLVRPVWLRLVVEGQRWTAYTSLDGTSWTPVGTQSIEPLGIWVGLAATSHRPGVFVEAVFDRLSGFVPDTFVAIGEDGRGS
jgi:multiple sugar transport system substrate-binding protein